MQSGQLQDMLKNRIQEGNNDTRKKVDEPKKVVGMKK